LLPIIIYISEARQKTLKAYLNIIAFKLRNYLYQTKFPIMEKSKYVKKLVFLLGLIMLTTIQIINVFCCTRITQFISIQTNSTQNQYNQSSNTNRSKLKQRYQLPIGVAVKAKPSMATRALPTTVSFCHQRWQTLPIIVEQASHEQALRRCEPHGRWRWKGEMERFSHGWWWRWHDNVNGSVESGGLIVRQWQWVVGSGSGG